MLGDFPTWTELLAEADVGIGARKKNGKDAFVLEGEDRKGKERKGAKKVSTLVDADQSYYVMPEREKEALGWGALGKQYLSMG